MTNIHSYNEEDFGVVVAFNEGRIGLYTKESLPLCARDESRISLVPYALKRIQLKNDFHLRRPLIVWLELTRACNLKCRHCFASDVRSVEPLATEEPLGTSEVLRLLVFLRALGVPCLVLSGGEPLLRPDLSVIVNAASRLGFIFSLVTNGLLLTKTFINQFPRNNARLTISLDDLHLGTRPLDINPRWAYLQRTLLVAQQAGVCCHVSSTLTHNNLDTIKKIFDWLLRHGITFRTIPFTPIGRGASSPELQLSVSDVKSAADLWALEFESEETYLSFSTFFDYALTMVYMVRACEGGRFVCYITSTGDVFPCTTCAGAGVYPGGNIRRRPFTEIWCEGIKAFRTVSNWENFDGCRSCQFSSREYFCTNRCPPLATLYRGSPTMCGATTYDKESLLYRTQLLNDKGIT